MNEIVVELLTRLSEAQREDFEERAGIMQYDCGLTRDHAECLALKNASIQMGLIIKSFLHFLDAIFLIGLSEYNHCNNKIF